MPKAVELLRQGRNEELWRMCCGFLNLSLKDFMGVQERLLQEQLEIIGGTPLGDKIMRGARPRTVEEFRRQVPLTTYADYCPEFIERREDILPEKPGFWARTSGRTAGYECKWVPISARYAEELSRVLYGVGMLASCKEMGDDSLFPVRPKILYSVAPRPYISGSFADLLRWQTPIDYLPDLEKAEGLSYEERIRHGFNQAMSEGLEYFFGLSLVLVAVGEKFRRSSGLAAVRPFIFRPKALWRLARGKLRSRMEKRPMLPRDLWTLRGIIGSGVDSWVYKDKIEKLWGRRPLDLYSCTEGGVIATQTWDYEAMAFVPNLNFLEFIPEDEHLKWQMDHSYQPRTLLLDEVEAGQCYELVISNFHGGPMMRYRVGDMIRITSLSNDKLGIGFPQMAFERRADDMINFMVIKLTEKQIWQAIEKTGIGYEDWAAYKIPGEPVLHLLIELKEGARESEAEVTAAVEAQLVDSGKSSYRESGVVEDWREDLGFSVRVTLLPQGSFAGYMAQRQAEGADLAHIKPPHVNPPEKVLALLLAEVGETIVVTKKTSGAEDEAANGTPEEKIPA